MNTLFFFFFFQVRALQHDGSNLSWSCVDAKGGDILRFKASETTVRDAWVHAMSNMLSLHAEEIHRTMGKSEKEKRRRERKKEINERRSRAKERISNIGLKGMKHAAIARAKR